MQPLHRRPGQQRGEQPGRPQRQPGQRRRRHVHLDVRDAGGDVRGEDVAPGNRDGLYRGRGRNRSPIVWWPAGTAASAPPRRISPPAAAPSSEVSAVPRDSPPLDRNASRSRVADGSRAMQVRRQTIRRHDVEPRPRQQHHARRPRLRVARRHRREHHHLAGDVQVVRPRPQAGVHHRPRRAAERPGTVQHHGRRPPARGRSPWGYPGRTLRCSSPSRCASETTTSARRPAPGWAAARPRPACARSARRYNRWPRIPAETSAYYAAVPLRRVAFRQLRFRRGGPPQGLDHPVQVRAGALDRRVLVLSGAGLAARTAQRWIFSKSP